MTPALDVLAARPLVCSALLVLALPGSSDRVQSTVEADATGTGCTPAQRRDVLREMQAAVLRAVPDEVPSMARALAAGGPLAGWRLSHGYVVLAGAAAVAVDNPAAVDPQPQLLLYAPAATSRPGDWLDFDGPDDPYRLVGWGYFTPYVPDSSPPARPCVEPGQCLVHEAGWHLVDGGMRLTPGAAAEPPRPPDLDVWMWHSRIWDLHVWRGKDGEPALAFANPSPRPGGKELPAASFLQLVDGHLHPLPPPP